MIKSPKYFSMCLFFLLLHQTFSLKELARGGTTVGSRPGSAHPAGATEPLTWPGQDWRLLFKETL